MNIVLGVPLCTFLGKLAGDYVLQSYTVHQNGCSVGLDYGLTDLSNDELRLVGDPLIHYSRMVEYRLQDDAKHLSH